MLENVSVLIPYKPDNGQRDELFKFVKKFYSHLLPQVELCIGSSSNKLFSRSQAINAAAKQATRNIFIIADSDIIFDPNILIQAIGHLKEYAWVVPYTKVIDLNRYVTDNLLKSEVIWPIIVEGEPRNWIDTGGINVIPRKNFEKVRGFDERFIGWGREDVAFTIAMNTICGQYYRMPTSIYHLWHEKVGEKGNPNLRNSTKLLLRYKKRRRYRRAMLKLVNERGHNLNVIQ
jgi:predicted glycosyltransferase involved in capsule biosynthesis